MRTTPDAAQEAAVGTVLEILTGSWRSTCLYLGIRHGLPRLLGASVHQPPTAAELASLTGLPQERLRRLLRVWIDLGLVSDLPGDTYSLSDGFQCLGDDDSSIEALILLYEEDFRAAWTHAEQWLTGAATGFEVAHGMTIHQKLREDSGFARRFLDGMGALDLVFKHFAGYLVAHLEEGAPWTFLDVGGGGGTLARAILDRGVGVGAVQDLPHIVAGNMEVLSAAGIGAHAADFFETVPSGYNCYLLSRVLQDWDTPRSAQILRNIRAAVGDTGAHLWILERAVGRGRPLSNLWDIHLGSVASGGLRDVAEYLDLAEDTGWITSEIIPLPFENLAYCLHPV